MMDYAYSTILITLHY